MTIKVTKKHNGEAFAVKLSQGNIIAIMVALAPLYGLLITLNVKLSEIKTETEEKTKVYDVYINKQDKLNDCLKNGFLYEFGKNVYFYGEQYTYRGKRMR